jgi:SLT domain-containing protein
VSTYDAGSISASLRLDRSDFTKGLDAAKADAEKFSGKDYTAKVKADNTQANKAFADTQARADKLGKSAPKVKIAVDDAQAAAQIAQTQARIQRLNNIIARPQVSLEAQKAQAQIDALRAKLAELAGLDATPKVEADTAAAQAKLDDLTVKLDRLNTRDTEVRVKASADLLAAQAALAKLQQAEDGATESSGLLSGSMGLLKSPIAALIAGGAALAPILVTSGIGLAGVAGAAVSAAKPIEDAAKQAGGLRANLATLNPEQQQVARGFLGLQADYASFTKSLQPEVFSAFNSGLATAKTLLHDAGPVAASAGKGLDHVLADINADFHTSEWRQFFSFMGQTAEPDIEAVGRAFLSLMNALPPLLEDLQPVGIALLNVASKGGEALGIVGKVVQAARSSEQQDSNNDSVFDKFKQGISWITDHAPEGHKSIGDLVAGWLGVTSSAGQAATAQGHAVAAMQQAQPSATNLAADVSVLASNTANAATQTTALDDAWNILVGNFASKETAILNAQSAVKQFGQAVSQNGSGSLAAKQAFESAVTSIGQMVSALQKAHAPASEIYADLNNQITALKNSGPLNAEETQQLRGMQQAAAAVASSTVGWTSATKNAASALQANMLPALSQMKANTPAVRADVDSLTKSIINTGTQSSATHGARQKLIQDLESAGVQAKTARSWVNNLQTSINALHGKTVSIHMNGQGLYTITGSAIAKSQGKGGSGNAAGGLATGGRITGPGGPTADKAGLYALSHDEWVIRASSSNRYGHAAMNAVNQGKAVIGYASGGQAGGAGAGAVSGNLSGSYVTGMYSAFERRMQDAMVTSMKSAMKSAVAAATKAAAESVGGNVNYKPSAGVEQWRGVVVRALSLAGASTSLANNVLHQMQTESGGQPQIVNHWDRNAAAGTPSVGLMQVIGPTYKSFGAPKMGYPAPVAYGVSEQPLANTYAGIKYAQHAYGPNLLNSRGGIGSGKGYARGTDGAAAGWALTGERGPELVQFHGGETVLPAHVTTAILGGSQHPGYAKGTSNAKTSAASIAGLISGAPKIGWQKDVANLKSDLKVIATTLGIKGLGKPDVARLKGEQGKDTNELLVATAYMNTLTKARKQITGTTEPKLKQQIAALGKVGKLSASEKSLLASLKKTLANQEAEAAKIYTAIYGKPAAKPKSSSSDSGGDSGDTGDAGGDAASSGDTTAPAGKFVGTIPSPPGGADITGGGTGGVGGAGAPLGAGYTIAPSGSSGRGGFSDLEAFFGGAGGFSGGSGSLIPGQLERLIAAVKANPAAIGGHLGAALNGTSRSAFAQATFSSSSPMF